MENANIASMHSDRLGPGHIVFYLGILPFVLLKAERKKLHALIGEGVH